MPRLALTVLLFALLAGGAQAGDTAPNSFNQMIAGNFALAFDRVLAEAEPEIWIEGTVDDSHLFAGVRSSLGTTSFLCETGDVGETWLFGSYFMKADLADPETLRASVGDEKGEVTLLVGSGMKADIYAYGDWIVFYVGGQMAYDLMKQLRGAARPMQLQYRLPGDLDPGVIHNLEYVPVKGSTKALKAFESGCF